MPLGTSGWGLYERLGLDRGASEEEITQAYRKLSTITSKYYAIIATIPKCGMIAHYSKVPPGQANEQCQAVSAHRQSLPHPQACVEAEGEFSFALDTPAVSELTKATELDFAY